MTVLTLLATVSERLASLTWGGESENEELKPVENGKAGGRFWALVAPMNDAERIREKIKYFILTSLFLISRAD
jgi:hypothetical protein